MRLGLIACTDERGGIGKNGGLLFHFPDDLKLFKAVTKGCPVIMGRKTWLSLPYRPLPDRDNIVVTRHPEDDADLAGAWVAAELDSALELAEDFVAMKDTDEVWVIGGGEIYKELLPECSCALVTLVSAIKQADTYLPDLNNFFPYRYATPSIKGDIDGLPYRYMRLWYTTEQDMELPKGVEDYDKGRSNLQGKLQGNFRPWPVGL